MLRIDAGNISIEQDLRESLNPQDFEKTHAVTCVTWGRGEFRRHIALSTSGGQILLYNIDKQTTVKSAKSVTRLQDSNRAVNSLTFSPTNNSIMLSANSDGSVRLWDLRTNRRKASAVFPKQGDIAREVQCSPFDGTKFAAIYDSGGIQRWDVRNLTTCERRINAHSGAGLSLDWHTEYDYIVSGGLDKQIQIWNMGSDSRKPDHVIPSPSAVAKVRWQFDLQHSNTSSTHGVLNTDIVSCNMSLYNYCIYVWNPRRPYIPRYVVEEHSNVVTDVFWRNKTTVWSTSKDKTFKQHNLAHRTMAITELPTQALAWNHENELSFIFQDKHEEHYLQVSDEDLVSTEANRRMSSASFKIPSTPVPVNSAPPVTQAICTVAFPGWDANSFIFCAQNYIYDATEPDISFSSNRILDICFHNSLVASHAGKFRLAQTWRILHDIISSEKAAFLKFVPTKQPVHVALQPYASRITESLKGLSSAELTPSLIPIEDSLPGTTGRSRATSIERSRSRPPDPNKSETGSIRLFNTDTRQELSHVGITPEAPHNLSFSSSESDERDLIASSFGTNSPEVNSASMENMMSTQGKSQGENKLDDAGKSLSDSKADRNNKSITNRHGPPHLSLQTSDEYGSDPQASRISGHNSALLTPHLVGKSITGKHVGHGEGRLSTVNEISMNPRQDRVHSGASTPRSMANPFDAHKEYSSSNDSAESLYQNAATKMSSKSERPSITVSAGESMAKRYQEYLQTINHPWRAENMIQQAAQYAMEQGDVQTCATIGLLFMKDYPGAFESEQVIEEWIWAYLLLLRKHELHLICAEIIKHSPFPAIRELGQIETSLDILCHRCKHPLTDNTAAAREAYQFSDDKIAFWYCGHCHKLLEGCIFCHIPVKGISITIFECGHKIHQECMTKWIKAIEQIQETMKHNDTEYPIECPSGCQTILVH